MALFLVILQICSYIKLLSRFLICCLCDYNFRDNVVVRYVISVNNLSGFFTSLSLS